jgi:hypothetical protein
MGGPQAIANAIRNNPKTPDPKLTDQIERQQVGQPYERWDFLKHGKPEECV